MCCRGTDTFSKLKYFSHLHVSLLLQHPHPQDCNRYRSNSYRGLLTSTDFSFTAVAMEPLQKKMKFAHDSLDISPSIFGPTPTDKEVAISEQDTTATLAPISLEQTSEAKHKACDQVLGTTELLEAILLHLDTKTLLLSQRVSKAFKETIITSLPLQQALFLKPSTIMTPTWNQFAFPRGRNIYFRGCSKVSIVDVSTEPDFNNTNQTLEPGHGIDLSIWFWIHGGSRNCKKETPELWPLLIRQPAAALKLDVECSVCETSIQCTFQAGGTFGDLVDYLENEIECDCEPGTESDEEMVGDGDDEDADEDNKNGGECTVC